MKRKLNFGCGTDIKKDYYNVDILNNKGVDKVFDFDKFPYPLKSASFDYILLDNVLEHLFYPQKVLNELYRISKENGIIEIIVPYYKSEGAFHDPTHKTFWSIRGIEQLLNPSYSDQEKFIILENKRFSTNKLRYIPSFIRKFLDYFFWNFFTGVNSKIKVLSNNKNGLKRQYNQLLHDESRINNKEDFGEITEKEHKELSNIIDYQKQKINKAYDNLKK